ncbi:MAG: hypothetical protein GPJ51_13515 [Candidatus Heimdallarchaeota archaeon]|nr:hypothetical protein [Candidatus Heimdallarchaeota archaeon]
MDKKIFKKKIFSYSLLGLLVLLSCLTSTDTAIISLNGVEEINEVILNYTTHDPILIDSSDDFTTYGFPGTGDPGTPFIIANYSITNGVTYSIKIIDVNDYFIIENCYVETSTWGIILFNIGTGRAIIRNNTCSSHYFGISIQNTLQSQVLNNTVLDSERGIDAYFAGFSTIQDNDCTNCKIAIESSSSGEISILNNTLQNSLVGISISYLYLATISNNTLINTGFYFDPDPLNSYSTFTFTENTINGLPVAVIFNEADQTIDASLYGQIIVINSSRILITNPSINPEPNYGIHLFFSDNCSVIDTINVNNLYCILAYYSPDTEIINNFCNNTYIGLDYFQRSGSGIEIKYSNRSIVSDNVCKNFGEGIKIFRSMNSNILRNTCDYNRVGIGINSQDCLIEENSINHNRHGILLGYMTTDIVTDNNVIFNTVTLSQYYGIILDSYSKNNIIHHNIFIDNSLGGSHGQAYDEGQGNIWYDTSTNQGNYWSDWSGTGSYSIYGTAYSEDPYPLSSISEFNTTTSILLAFLVSCIAIVPLIKKRR